MPTPCRSTYVQLSLTTGAGQRRGSSSCRGARRRGLICGYTPKAVARWACSPRRRRISTSIGASG
eukprot:14863336-Alexandrium_andersonii.AAC.1